MEKCQQDGCPTPATVMVSGPHGDVPYCESHAQHYELIMRTLGTPTKRTPIVERPAYVPEPPTETAEDPQPKRPRRLSPAQRTKRTQAMGMAEGELGMMAARLREQYGLTRMEMMAVLTGVIATVATYGVRDAWGGE